MIFRGFLGRISIFLGVIVGYIAAVIALIELVTVGRVPGIDQAAFLEQAEAAKEGCPVSRALAAVPEITLTATLES